MVEDKSGYVELDEINLYSKVYSEKEILNEIVKQISKYEGDYDKAALAVLNDLIDKGDVIVIPSDNVFPYPPPNCPELMYIPMFKTVDNAKWKYIISEISIPKTVMPGVLININRLRNWIESGCPNMLGFKQIHGIVDKCLSRIIFMEIINGNALYNILNEEEERLEKIEQSELLPNYEGVVTDSFAKMQDEIRSSRHSLGVYRVPARFTTVLGGSSKDEWGMPSIKGTRYVKIRRPKFEPIKIFVEVPTYAAILRWSSPGGAIPDDKKYSEVREITIFFKEYKGDLLEYGKELINRVLLTPTSEGGLGWLGDYDIDSILSDTDAGFSGVNVRGSNEEVKARMQLSHRGRDKALFEVVETTEDESEGKWKYSRWRADQGEYTGEIINEGDVDIE